MDDEIYKYTVVSGDTWWGLANEYAKINKNISNARAQLAIKKINPNIKNLKIGDIVNLPFEKESTAITKPKTPYEKWQATVNEGITDSSWDEYDKLIKTTVSTYNARLVKTSRNVLKAMPGLKWTWIKAMVWVESGGPKNSAWKVRPMQIGNPGDPGYGALKKGEGAAKIIVDTRLKADINKINTPTVNIRIGIAYLISRLATIEIRSLRSDKDKKEYEYMVVAGDSFDKISKKIATTIDELKKSNPMVTPVLLKPKMKIKYHKASLETVIVDWRLVTASTLYARYNQGDELYAKKLTYLMTEVFPELQRKE